MPESVVRRFPWTSANAPQLGTVLLAAAVVVGIITLPGTGGYTRYVLALVAVQLMAVLSLNLLMGYAGQISLGQAAFVGVGAYSAAQMVEWGVPFLVVVPGAAAVTAAVATVVGLPSLRIRGLQLAATTLAFGVVAERLLFTRPWDPESSLGMEVARPAALVDDGAFLLFAVGLLLAVGALDLAIRRSWVGRALLAVRDREDTAAARGVNVAHTKLLAYALSGLYAGVAGAGYAYLLERITPDPFDIWTSLGYVAVVVVGGLASVAGVVAAGAAFTALPELLRPAATYAPLVGAVALMLVPVLRPEGLGGLLGVRLRRRRAPLDATPPPPDRPRLVPVLAAPRRAVRLAVPVPTLLDVRDLHLAYGGNHVLQGVDVRVGRGQRVGLIGPNGAGKTSVFQCISGLATPRSGLMQYRGLDLRALAPHDRPALGIARTFQQVGLSPVQTVRENVLGAQHLLAGYGLGAALAHTPNAARGERRLRERADVALAAIGLEHVANTRVGDLPHGQQRLAEVAAALATGPELLMLDEPAAGMNPDESDALADMLRKLADDMPLSLLVIDHHVPFVTGLCDWVLVLADGVVMVEGPPEAVVSDPRVAAIFLGNDRADMRVEEAAGV